MKTRKGFEKRESIRRSGIIPDCQTTEKVHLAISGVGCWFTVAAQSPCTTTSAWRMEQ